MQIHPVVDLKVDYSGLLQIYAMMSLADRNKPEKLSLLWDTQTGTIEHHYHEIR
jgi:hypothetical protein